MSENNIKDLLETKLEGLLPRTNCPASCDGFGTYAEMDSEGDPEPAQCQWCYEVVMPLREAILKLVREERENAVKDWITKVYGERCETKDTEDFPELKHDERCITCRMWETFEAELKGDSDD